MSVNIDAKEPAEKRARTDWDVLKRLLAYLRGESLLLGLVLLMLVLQAVGTAAGPTLIGRAIDQFIVVDDRGGLAQTMLMLAGVYLLGYVGFIGNIYFMSMVSQRLLKSLRSDIFEHVQKLSIGYFFRHGAGDLMSRLVNDTGAIGTLMGQQLIQSLGSFFGLIAVLVAMFSQNVQLSLVTIIILPLMIVVTWWFSFRSRAAFKETRQALGQLSSDLEENLTSVREAQSFAVTAEVIEHFRQDNVTNRDAEIRAAGITAAFAPLMDVLSTLATVLVAGYGGYLAIFGDGTVTVGVVVAFLSYAQQFFRPVQLLSTLYTTAQSAFAAGDRVFDLLDAEPEIVNKAGAKEMSPANGHVQFNDVVFGYDDSKIILDGVSLEAQPGEMIAFVGETGAGKSTFVNLVGRFYDVNAGQLLIDGTEVRDVTVRSLRQQIGEVPQNSFLFADTVANNLKYGRQDATLDEVIAAATAAKAHDFIMELSDGYETVLSSGASSISQGQRQLLCIARAILADPRILILDEATSNIDTRTERLVQEAIDHLLEGRTAFVIAHRLSTIRHANKIVVIGKGGIVEQGNHDELLAVDGYYAGLIKAQELD
ncbi:MAG: ABC transporter ATP-binding protein [Anaerolineae bacterium]